MLHATLKTGFLGASTGASVLGEQPRLKAASRARQTGKNLRDTRDMDIS
jgi:hypothetical protein